MKLQALLAKLDYTVENGTLEKEVSAVVYDSRKVEKDCLFICIKGMNFDGHDYVTEVIDKGASVLVVEQDIVLPQTTDVTIIKVADTRYAMAFISAAWFGNPAEKLKVIGITGTKGKTTTAYMVYHILEKVGIKAGLVGTVEVKNGKETIPASHTTPESFLLQKYFREMVDNGAEYCVMEASSQALSQYRFAGERFVCGIFLNLTQDHLDWHGTMENYYKAKKSLFRFCDNAVINTDDKYGKRLYDELSRGKDKISLVSVSSSDVADFFAVNIKLRAGGVSYWLSSSADEKSFPVTFSSSVQK